VGFLHPLGTPVGKYAACVPTFVTPALVQRVYNGSEKQTWCSGKCCCFNKTGCTLLLQLAKQKGTGRRRTFKSQNWIGFIFIFFDQADVSSFMTCFSGTHLERHCQAIALFSISAMLSQLPCSGVQ
jgi:hypothetical protein